MTDSLGGILTGGLLGNMILGRFNLFLDIEIVDITPTPTPTPSGPSVTPTPTPASVVGGGGGRYPDLGEHERIVKITITHKGKQHISIHKVNDLTLRVSINILKALQATKDRSYKIYVNIVEKLKQIKVSINGN